MTGVQTCALPISDSSKDNVFLQGYNINFPAYLSANQLSVVTAGAIGASGAPLAVSANRLTLQGSEAYVTNDKAVSLNGVNTTGAVYINNGANDITIDNPVVSTGAGMQYGWPARTSSISRGRARLAHPMAAGLYGAIRRSTIISAVCKAGNRLCGARRLMRCRRPVRCPAIVSCLARGDLHLP